MSFRRINRENCKQLLVETEVTLLDIRDPQSFIAGHIEQAIHIEQIDLDRFVEEQPKEKPLVICCYHNNSNQSTTTYFAEKGFTNIYSLDDGYKGWRSA